MKDLTSLIDKIKKLLSLSTSNNPHEASLAMERVQGLLAKHKVELSELDLSERPVETVGKTVLNAGKNARRVTWWKYWVVQGVCRATGCRPIFSRGVGFEVVGKPSDIEIANELIDWIVVQIEQFALNAGLNEKNEFDSFKKGAATVVKERLEAQSKTLETEQPKYGELMVLDKQLVNASFKKFFPSVRSMLGGSSTAGSAHAMGKEAGTKVSLAARRLSSPNRLLN